MFLSARPSIETDAFAVPTAPANRGLHDGRALQVITFEDRKTTPAIGVATNSALPIKD